ncbi:hypothetical protein EVAR_90289_1 [Eumeta japonica]|uniref:BESS domain-containing protein n=1 Tax=Eumeta variegata TaxID=151549 RepID=A0A4C1Z7P5_EUMVA|nr:hypothetical protein EVAR_90289_1 [Eumeta japonica]
MEPKASEKPAESTYTLPCRRSFLYDTEYDTDSSISSTRDDSDQSEPYSVLQLRHNHTILPKKRLNSVDQEILNGIKSTSTTSSTQPLDDDHAFILSILPRMKKIREDEKFEFRIKVLQLLSEFTKLNNNVENSNIQPYQMMTIKPIIISHTIQLNLNPSHTLLYKLQLPHASHIPSNSRKILCVNMLLRRPWKKPRNGYEEKAKRLRKTLEEKPKTYAAAAAKPKPSEAAEPQTPGLMTTPTHTIIASSKCANHTSDQVVKAIREVVDAREMGVGVDRPQALQWAVRIS